VRDFPVESQNTECCNGSYFFYFFLMKIYVTKWTKAA